MAVREMILAENAEGAAHGAREDPADAAGGLRRHLPGDGGPARDDPAARSAAPRVPAARGRGRGAGPRRSSRSPAEKLRERVRALSRRPTRCSATAAAGSASRTPRSTRRRSARSSRPAVEAMRGGAGTRARDHDPARRDARGSSSGCKVLVDETAAKVGRESGQAVAYKVGTMIEVPRAALRANRDRAELRLLLLRHERPDADDLRLLARRRGARSCRPTSRRGSCPRTRSRASTSTAWASSSRSATRARARGQARS